MHASLERSAAHWFTQAAQSYVERHQGCPWCGESHCLFRNRRPEREQYSCYHCDFFSCHVDQGDLYLVTPGNTAVLAGE